MLFVMAVVGLSPGAPVVQHRAPVAEADTGFHSIRWYEALAVVGASGVLVTVDGPVERLVQRHRSPTTDDAASAFRQMGDPRIALGTTAGVTLIGVVVRDAAVRDAGIRAAASVATGAVATEILKFGLGRGRPNALDGPTDFKPFSNERDSLGVESRGSSPSGHSMIAFALATSFSDDLHSRAASIALYTVASGTALSRLNDDRHWLSDVVAGAALGITSARLVSGRWRVFGLRPPGFLLSPSLAVVSWQAPAPF